MSNPSLGVMLSMAAGTTLISFSSVFVKLADADPTAAGFYRNLFGGLALAAFVLLRGKPSVRKAAWPLVMACAALFTLDLTFWHHSIHMVGPGLSTLLANCQVFFLAGFGVLLGERFGVRMAAAVFMAVAGLYLLVGLGWQDLAAAHRTGVLFGLLTALFYASYIVSLRRLQRERTFYVLCSNMALVSLATAAFMAAEIPFLGESFAVGGAASWLVLVGYGVLCQGVGWMLISFSLPKLTVTAAGLLILLQPALAFVWDVVLFSRPTSVADYSGLVLVLAAIFLGLTRRPARRGP